MWAASIASKLLRLLGFPRFERGAALAGPHEVGAIRLRLDAAAPNCQIIYPIEAGHDATSSEPYFRPEEILGLSSYTKLPHALFADVLSCPHPCAFGAPCKKGTEKWPLAIFSHGLGGSEDMYLQFCMQLASFGYVVVAIEHEDCSGCHAQTVDGEMLRYRSPPEGFVYGREAVVNFRAPFLAKRVEEMLAVVSALRQGPSDATAAAVFAECTVEQPPLLVGHSFGASGVILTSQRLEAQALVLLDPWAFAVADAELLKPLTAPASVLLSQAWTENKELFAVHTLLRANRGVPCLWQPVTRHQSVSDTPTWTMGFIAERTGAASAGEVPHLCRRVTAEMCHVLYARARQGDASGTASGLKTADLLEGLAAERRGVLREHAVPTTNDLV